MLTLTVTLNQTLTTTQNIALNTLCWRSVNTTVAVLMLLVRVAALKNKQSLATAAAREI